MFVIHYNLLFKKYFIDTNVPCLEQMIEIYGKNIGHLVKKINASQTTVTVHDITERFRFITFLSKFFPEFIDENFIYTIAYSSFRDNEPKQFIELFAKFIRTDSMFCTVLKAAIDSKDKIVITNLIRTVKSFNIDYSTVPDCIISELVTDGLKSNEIQEYLWSFVSKDKCSSKTLQIIFTKLCYTGRIDKIKYMLRTFKGKIKVTAQACVNSVQCKEPNTMLFLLSIRPHIFNSTEFKTKLTSKLILVQDIRILSFLFSKYEDISDELWDKIYPIKNELFEFFVKRCKEMNNEEVLTRVRTFCFYCDDIDKIKIYMKYFPKDNFSYIALSEIIVRNFREFFWNLNGKITSSFDRGYFYESASINSSTVDHIDIVEKITFNTSSLDINVMTLLRNSLEKKRFDVFRLVADKYRISEIRNKTSAFEGLFEDNCTLCIDYLLDLKLSNKFVIDLFKVAVRVNGYKIIDRIYSSKYKNAIPIQEIHKMTFKHNEVLLETIIALEKFLPNGKHLIVCSKGLNLISTYKSSSTLKQCSCGNLSTVLNNRFETMCTLCFQMTNVHSTSVKYLV